MTPAQFHDASQRILAAINTVIEGKAEAAELALTVLLAQGHLLVEDVPGVGKTMLAKTLARTIDCSVSRIQFTPDLLPSDVTGVSIYNQSTQRFEFKPGAIFANIVIGDEINRASAEDPVRAAGMRWRSARSRVDGTSYRLPQPLHGGGHAEPDRDGGHLPVAGGPARPLHGQDFDGLSGRGRGDGNAADTPVRLPAGRRDGGRLGGGSRGHDQRGARNLRLPGSQGVHRGAWPGNPGEPAAAPRCQPAGSAAAAPRGKGLRRAAPTRLCAPGRCGCGGGSGAGAPDHSGPEGGQFRADSIQHHCRTPGQAPGQPGFRRRPSARG